MSTILKKEKGRTKKEVELKHKVVSEMKEKEKPVSGATLHTGDWTEEISVCFQNTSLQHSEDKKG